MPDQMHTSEVEFIDQHRQVVRVHLRGISLCWPGYVPIREIVATTVSDGAIMCCQWRELRGPSAVIFQPAMHHDHRFAMAEGDIVQRYFRPAHRAQRK